MESHNKFVTYSDSLWVYSYPNSENCFHVRLPLKFYPSLKRLQHWCLTQKIVGKCTHDNELFPQLSVSSRLGFDWEFGHNQAAACNESRYNMWRIVCGTTDMLVHPFPIYCPCMCHSFVVAECEQILSCTLCSLVRMPTCEILTHVRFPSTTRGGSWNALCQHSLRMNATPMQMCSSHTGHWKQSSIHNGIIRFDLQFIASTVKIGLETRTKRTKTNWFNLDFLFCYFYKRRWYKTIPPKTRRRNC